MKRLSLLLVMLVPFSLSAAGCGHSGPTGPNAAANKPAQSPEEMAKRMQSMKTGGAPTQPQAPGSADATKK